MFIKKIYNKRINFFSIDKQNKMKWNAESTLILLFFVSMFISLIIMFRNPYDVKVLNSNAYVINDWFGFTMYALLTLYKATRPEWDQRCWGLGLAVFASVFWYDNEVRSQVLLLSVAIIFIGLLFKPPKRQQQLAYKQKQKRSMKSQQKKKSKSGKRTQ